MVARKFASIAAVVAILALGGAIFWAAILKEAPAGERAPESRAESRNASTSTAPDEPVGRGPSADPERATAAARPKARATLRGRFVDARGNGIGGALTQFEGGGAPDAKIPADGEGRFSIPVDPHESGAASLRAEARGYARAMWFWESFSGDLAVGPGETRELGDFELTRGGNLACTILGSDGERLRRKVFIDAWNLAPGTAARGFLMGSDGRPMAIDGEALLEDLPPGAISLRVELFGDFQSYQVAKATVRAGETQPVEIRTPFPSRPNAILVIPKIDRAGPPLSAEHVKLTAPDGTQLSSKRDGPFWRWRFDGLAQGRYALTVDDPRYAPARIEGLEPSDDTVQVPIRGLASLHLEVLDADGDRPLHRYQLSAGFRDESLRKERQEILGVRDSPPEGGLFPGFAADELSLWIQAPGFQPTVEHIASLKAGETREVTVRLAHERPPEGARLAGVILEDDGETAAAGAAVSLLSWADGAAEASTVRTIQADARGRFSFPGLTSGTWGALAGRGGSCAVSSGALELGEDEARDSVRLVLPPRCAAAGRVLLPEGWDPEGLTLWFAWEDPNANKAGAAAAAPRFTAGAKTDGEGRFSVAPLRPGRHRVFLELRAREVRVANAWGAGFLHEIGTVEAAPGAAPRADLDLREGMLVKLELEVRAAGAPLANASVAVSRGSSPYFGADHWESLFTRTDASGRASLGPLPAVPLEISVGAGERGWSYVAPAPLESEGRPVVARAVDVPLHEGTVRVIRADGSPAAETQLYCWMPLKGRGVVGTAPYKTDAKGNLTLQYPPGPVRISLGDETGTFEWTAAGPATPTCALAKIAR